MRVIVVLIFGLIYFGCCQAQDRHYTIDSSILGEIEMNNKAEELAHIIPNHSYFIFMDQALDDSTNSRSNFSILDTISYLLPNVCGCKLKNDTIYIAGGVFYAGGIGYEIKLTRKSAEPRIIIAGGPRYKKQEQDKFVKELYLDCKSFKLVLAKQPQYKLNKYLAGKILIQSKKFLEKTENGPASKEYFMKILFECELWKEFGF